MSAFESPPATVDRKHLEYHPSGPSGGASAALGRRRDVSERCRFLDGPTPVKQKINS